MANKNRKRFKRVKKKKLFRELRLPRGKDFSSNDYLSLAQCKKIKQELSQKIKTFPIGSGGSRLLRGHHQVFNSLETYFSSFQGRPDALFFSSGYMANLGLSALFNEAHVFSDQYNHNSIISSIKLSKKKACHIYPHKNLKILEKQLKQTSGKKIIITESLFSMEGDFAELLKLSKLASKNEALLIVDEAHSTGIFGQHGEGLCRNILGDKDHVISVHPCGKALAGSGALIVGPKWLKPWLINFSSSFIFSTAPNPICAIQILVTLKFLAIHPERRTQLHQNILHFKSLLHADLKPKQDSPIFSIPVKGNQRALNLSLKLEQKGYDIRAIRYPSVEKNKVRLRIIIHSKHEKKDLKNLAKILNTLTGHL